MESSLVKEKMESSLAFFEKELSSGEIDKKLFAEKSKEYIAKRESLAI